MGHDLGDLYRDRLTIRQLWVRINALPDDAPLWESLRQAKQAAEDARRSRDLDDALTRYRR